MDQAELEAHSQMRKLHRGRHATSYWNSRQPADGTSASDSYWKALSRPNHSVSHSHEQSRRQDYGVSEPVTNCYPASSTYRPKNRALTSVLPKPARAPAPDQSYRTPQQGSRTARNKLLTNNNVAVVRKPCYKDDVEEDEEVKYDEEDVNYAEENAEEEVADEVDEDQDESYEYNDKEYEEQEADDEVDDESDAFQTQLHRLQHKVQKPSNYRAQHLSHAEQQQELRKIQHQQYLHKMYPQDQKLNRFYPQSLDTQHPIPHDTSYGDAAEVISDDQHSPPWTPDPRKSSRRMSETHHTVPPWIPERKCLERNRERLTSSLVTAQDQQRHQRHHHHQLHQQQQQYHQHQHQHQQLRRHRAIKPEIESLMMPAQPANPLAKKCCICGGSTAPVRIRKGNCRLHEYRGFAVKGPPGEDGEAKEEVICGRCAKIHDMENFRLGCEPPSSDVPAPVYAAKANHSRIHHRPPTYECPEDSQTVDEILSAYTSGQPRTTNLDYAMAPRERTRHSVQSARSPSRRASYYNER